jgi:hypothetical protein
LSVTGATWHDTGTGSLAVLPYETLRGCPDPDATLLEFFTAAYQAGATAAAWDVDAVARAPRPTPT